MSFFSRMFAAFAEEPRPSAPDGYRAYAVGDVHGRLDLLNALLARIEEDIAGRPGAETVIVFLGDLIDRGPDSAGVIERLRTYAPEGAVPVFLMGNHEEVMLSVLAGRSRLLADWLRFGGAEFLRSYGLDPVALGAMREAAAAEAIRHKIPAEHKGFVAGFADTFRFGDYLFVHAGIRPGVPISAQTPADLRWIRDAFLDDTKDHGFVVVHGHTISENVELRSNRIGIDTGAYRSGTLTALALEGTERWFLDTRS